MGDILRELCSLRAADAERAERALPRAELERCVAAMPDALDFAAAFRGRTPPRVIAELKRASPSKGPIRPDLDPVACARELCEAGAAALSVLCEPHRFLGSEAFLRAVRPVAPVPLLYKDFLTTEYQLLQARAAGADAALLVVAALPPDRLAALLTFAHDIGLQALVETHDADEIRVAVETGARVIGVNSRNLRDFSMHTADAFALLAAIPADRIRIAESGLATPEDARRACRAGADGLLIGEALMRAEHPGERLRQFLEAPPPSPRRRAAIKVCGINDPAFAREAESLGVDYLGLIFYAASPRSVTPERALDIARALRGRARLVGVFVDTPPSAIPALARDIGLSVVQLHSPAYTADDIRALHAAGLEVWQMATDSLPAESPADAFLIEASPQGSPTPESGNGALPGGTGHRSDWSLVSAAHRLGRKAVLAGGIGPDNLAEALATGCDVADVNSALETSPGHKSTALLHRLLSSLEIP